MRWPTTKDESDYLRVRQEQNKGRAETNPNENWANAHLESLGIKWTRQALWGYRIFDFWSAEFGIAVEIDGLEHNKDYDASRDTYNYDVSGVVVLRVRNMNTEDIAAALYQISHSCKWWQRRESLGLRCKQNPFAKTHTPTAPSWIAQYLPAMLPIVTGLSTFLSTKAKAKADKSVRPGTARGNNAISEGQYKEMYLHEVKKNKALAEESRMLKARIKQLESTSAV